MANDLELSHQNKLSKYRQVFGASPSWVRFVDDYFEVIPSTAWNGEERFDDDSSALNVKETTVPIRR